MADTEWPNRRLNVAAIQLDEVNPRLTPSPTDRTQREIIQYLFEHEDALTIAQSIARNGYFANEGLLVVREGDRWIALEGNRRLAALKALRDPQLLEGRSRAAVERALKDHGAAPLPPSVPVVVAPDRAAADRQIVVRHVGTPVRRWRPENKANFILAKVAEGYTERTLQDTFDFTPAEIRDAREMRVLAELLRSTELPADLKDRVTSPDPAVITTLHRFVDSPPGREALRIERDPDSVFRVQTTKAEFNKGWRRLATDVLGGKIDSRGLNTHKDIEDYTGTWTPAEQVSRKRGSFKIESLISAAAESPAEAPEPRPAAPRAAKTHSGVVPPSLRVKFGSTRLSKIRTELVGLKRDTFPNAGAVLFRVFFELAVRDYLTRTGEMDVIRQRLQGIGKLRGHGEPEMGQLEPEILRVAEERLSKGDRETVQRALRKERWLEDLNAYVHRPRDIPTPEELLVVWTRLEPLLRLMLEQPHEAKQ